MGIGRIESVNLCDVWKCSYIGEIIHYDRILYRRGKDHVMRGVPGIPGIPGIPGLPGLKGPIAMSASYEDVKLD